MGGNLTAVFCDTGWEHPDTYKHVNDVCLQMGVRLITLKSKYDFVSLAVHKKRFPSTNARFCTSELKMKPMIDYVLSLKESCIIIQGIRAGESTARAAMEEECMYFKSYFQPNKKGRTENYRSKDVKEWCSQFDASVLRPIFKWSAQQVIDCILGIALLFNRCDSNKFQDIIFTKATGMMFLRNRIKFFRPDGTRGDSPGCGSVLIAFGRENAEILRNCSLQGKYVELNNDK